MEHDKKDRLPLIRKQGNGSTETSWYIEMDAGAIGGCRDISYIAA